MSMLPDERSMGRYLARHDLIERIVDYSPPADPDGAPLRSVLSNMSMFELWRYAKEIGVSIAVEEK